MSNLIFLVPIFGLLALGFAYWKAIWVKQQDEGNDLMKEINPFMK